MQPYTEDVIPLIRTPSKSVPQAACWVRCFLAHFIVHSKNYISLCFGLIVLVHLPKMIVYYDIVSNTEVGSDAYEETQPVVSWTVKSIQTNQTSKQIPLVPPYISRFNKSPKSSNVNDQRFSHSVVRFSLVMFQMRAFLSKPNTHPECEVTSYLSSNCKRIWHITCSQMLFS